MGLFSKIKGGVKAMQQQREALFNAGTLGSIPVPGSGALDLPASTIQVTFELTKPAHGDERNDLRWGRPDISIEVHGESGPVAIERPSGRTEATIDDDRRHRVSWVRFTPPAAGSYTITAAAENSWYEEQATNPALLFDARPAD